MTLILVSALFLLGARHVSFSEGLAVTIVDGWDYHFVSKKVKPVLPGYFYYCQRLCDGACSPSLRSHFDDATWRYIDRQGKTVFRYDEHGWLPHGGPPTPQVPQ